MPGEHNQPEDLANEADQMTDEQREMLASLRDQARQTLEDNQPEPDDPEHGYDIPLPEGDEDVVAGVDPADVEFAFVVYYDRDTGAIALPNFRSIEIEDPEGKPLRLRPRRDAAPDDLYRACAEVSKDVQNMQIASQTINTLMQIQQSMQQQMVNERAQQQMASQSMQRIREAAEQQGMRRPPR